jgi:hypothetical protein
MKHAPNIAGMPKSVVSWRKECRVSVRAQFLEIAQSWDSIAARSAKTRLPKSSGTFTTVARHIAGLKARIVSLESEGHARPRRKRNDYSRLSRSLSACTSSTCKWSAPGRAKIKGHRAICCAICVQRWGGVLNARVSAGGLVGHDEARIPKHMPCARRGISTLR